MGKTLPIKIGTNYTKLSVERADNFVGNEFSDLFAGLPSVVSGVRIVLLDDQLGESVITIYIYDTAGNSRTVASSSISASYSYNNNLVVMPDEYIGVITTGIHLGTPPGARVEIVGKILREGEVAITSLGYQGG